MSGESIKVCCRFRKEMTTDTTLFDDWEFDEYNGTIKLRDKSFTYDYILNADTEQDQMYDKVGRQTITDFMNGFNGTIFAYGQSGSGKTFSMLGPEDVTDALAKDFKSVPEKVTQLYGITPRAVLQMFESINEYAGQGSSCILYTSYIEVYNETIKCLLSKKENLKIREQPGVGMNVADKDIRVCRTPEEIFECISLANRNRAVTGTLQNARSSRSHTILMMDFEYNGFDGVKKTSRLNLVDLAGSERIAKTGCEGQSLKEAQKINQSLTTLGMCIMALTTPGSKHIPFRNSKLTLILKESLGGNSKTTLLCTASRKREHNEESIQTLYFAARAKAIKNACKSNVQLGAKELQYLAENMKIEVMKLRGNLKKAGLSFNLLTDPKMLAFITNDAIDLGDGEDTTGDSHEVSHSGGSKGDIKSRKRVSLLHLSEEEIVMKYCELKAKYDNLLESAGQKIYQLSNQPRIEGADTTAMFNDIKNDTDEKLKEIVDSNNIEINEMREKLEAAKKTIDQKDDELNKKVQEMLKEKHAVEEERDNALKEIEAVNEMMTLNQNDIVYFQEKVEKKKKKSAILKEENKNLKADIESNKQTVEDLNKKLNDFETINLESKQKLEEAVHKNESFALEIENLKSQIKQKDEAEAFQANKNKELSEEINKNLESISNSEKRIAEANNKFSEFELKYKNDVESLTNKNEYSQTQIEGLKKENENMNKMMLEKISDQEILAQKENLLKETKATLEKRIEDISNEVQKAKNDTLELSTKMNNEKTELSSTIDAVTRELRNKSNEFDEKCREVDTLTKSSEEKAKLEVQKTEQLQARLDGLVEKVKELENTNLSITEQEKKSTYIIQNLEREVKDKNSQIEATKESYNSVTKTNERNDKELKELKESIVELKNKLKEELEGDKKKLQNDLSLLKNEIDIKNKKIEDGDLKVNELKQEIKVLQGSYQRLQNRISELEMENVRTRKESIVYKKESNTIKDKVNLKDSKNIFGVLLKKAGVTNDHDYLKQAKVDSKEMSKRVEEIYKDKINEFRNLKQNIVSMSPKTISSRSDMSELPDLDFCDEDAYKKAEEKLLERERTHVELKEKLQKVKEEQDKEDESTGMIV